MLLTCALYFLLISPRISPSAGYSFEERDFKKVSYDEFLYEDEEKRVKLTLDHAIPIPGTDNITCKMGYNGFCNLIFPSEDVVINKTLIDKFHNVDDLRMLRRKKSKAVISDDIFSGLFKLEHMVLRNLTIKKSFFQDTPDLKYLRIEVGYFVDNPLTIFENLLKLEKLTVADKTNLPEVVTEEFFKGLSNLRDLEITDCAVREIRLVPLPYLTILNLYGDKLTNISGMLKNTPQLTNLHIEYNNITAIDWDEFENIPHLQSFSFEGNVVENLDAEKIGNNMKNLRDISYSAKFWNITHAKKFSGMIKAKLPNVIILFT